MTVVTADDVRKLAGNILAYAMLMEDEDLIKVIYVFVSVLAKKQNWRDQRSVGGDQTGL